MRKWADAKIATGQEPRWAWYQLMKLREALDALIGEMEAESIALEMEFYRWRQMRSAVRGWWLAIPHPTVQTTRRLMSSGS